MLNVQIVAVADKPGYQSKGLPSLYKVYSIEYNIFAE